MNNLPFEKVEREILVKKEADSKFGVEPYSRPVIKIPEPQDKYSQFIN